MIEKVVQIKNLDNKRDGLDDLNYWLKKSSKERIAAVEFLKRQFHGGSARLQRVAKAFHGAPRYTGDIDIFIKPDPDNAKQIMTAGEYGDISVYYIGKEQYVLNKRTLGRKKDLADLEALGEE